MECHQLRDSHEDFDISNTQKVKITNIKEVLYTKHCSNCCTHVNLLSQLCEVDSILSSLLIALWKHMDGKGVLQEGSPQWDQILEESKGVEAEKHLLK